MILVRIILLSPCYCLSKFINLSIYQLVNLPFFPLSFSSWVATPTELEERLDHIK